MDQSQLAVRHGNRQEIALEDSEWLPLTEVGPTYRKVFSQRKRMSHATDSVTGCPLMVSVNGNCLV